MTTAGRPGVPLAVLRRVTRSRPAPPAGERCDMCATPIEPGHSHVVDLHSRALMCACRACYLLFTDEHADLRYRAVPDRYLSFAGPELDELQVPVGLVFLFRNSTQDRMVAFYPGPAGATESELPLPAWNRMVARDPRLAILRPDVEALLVRCGSGPPSCYLVPIDACYELVGQLRSRWRGFDGGQEAHDAIEAFFSQVQARSRPVPHE
jgi:Family of unknown function (DUF5947)